MSNFAICHDRDKNSEIISDSCPFVSIELIIVTFVVLKIRIYIEVKVTFLDLKLIGAREQAPNLNSKSSLVEWLNSRGVGVEDRMEDRTEVDRSMNFEWVILVDLSRTL